LLPEPPDSPLVAYIRAEWPEVKEPRELERRALESFPKLDLLAEAKAARGHERANGNSAEEHKKPGRFYWNWLLRSESRRVERSSAGNGTAAPRQYPAASGMPPDPVGQAPDADKTSRMLEDRRKYEAQAAEERERRKRQGRPPPEAGGAP
jgi:hypothetical protein